MDQLIDSIRAAIADGADDAAKQAGANACRAILAALEARHGEPLASKPAAASPIATTFAALRGVPPEQLLDLVIAKLRSKLPADAKLAASRPVAFQLLPLPKPPGGGSP
jgi:hypothetical protein